MFSMQDAVQVLGEVRVAEILARVDDLLKQVLANQERYARRAPGTVVQRQAA
jgi:hypothetical protein